jgi:hypothetical protein
MEDVRRANFRSCLVERGLIKDLRPGPRDEEDGKISTNPGHMYLLILLQRECSLLLILLSAQSSCRRTRFKSRDIARRPEPSRPIARFR